MRRILLFMAVIAIFMSANAQRETVSIVPGGPTSVLVVASKAIVKTAIPALPVGRVFGEWSEWAFELECSENATLQASYAIKIGVLTLAGCYSFEIQEDWRYVGDVHIEYRCRLTWMPGSGTPIANSAPNVVK